MHTMLSVQATPDVANIRTAEFRGDEHTVIPVVALVEGVLWAANAPRPELALAEEFGRFPAGWDGSPVVFDHPKDADGVPVSANSPEVLETNAFGQMFNTVLDGTKLKSEIWINQSLVANLSEEAQATVAKLMKGDTIIEVSTGLFLLSEMSTGEFDGEHFEAIWRNVVPDHLAVLPEGVPGACSIADGCGAPRDNSMQPVMRAAQLNANCDCSVTGVILSTGDSTDDAAEEGLIKRLLHRMGALFAIRDNSEGVNDSDLRTALDIALNADEQAFIWIAAVFQGSDNEGTVVYQKDFEATFLERDFSMNTDGAIALGGDKTSVRPETKFVPVELQGTDTDSTIQENTMHTKEELVNELIANKAAQFTEEDRGWLEGLEDAQLAKLSPVDNAEEDAASDDESSDNDSSIELTPVGSTQETDDTANNLPVSTDDYIADAPSEIQEILNSGLEMHRARKNALVKGLVANTRCRFTAEQLESKDIGELENLTALASPDVSYVGNGANLTPGLRDNADTPPEPLKLFDLNAQNNADVA